MALGLLSAGGYAAGVCGTAQASFINADAAVVFQGGSTPSSDSTLAAATGPLTPDTNAGSTPSNALSPLTPAYQSSQIVVVGAGNTITLHLAQPVRTAQGRALGVFVNTGLVDATNTGTSDAGPSTFSPPSIAVVSVSKTNVVGSYVTLNGGSPISFSNPSNYYTDAQFSTFVDSFGFTEDRISGGTRPADQGKPFLGTLQNFANENYSQMLSTLNGSAGGTWLDLSGTGLDQVNYVNFTVPAGNGNRLVLDSVSGIVPEPSGVAFLLLGGLALRRGRRRVPSAR